MTRCCSRVSVYWQGRLIVAKPTAFDEWLMNFREKYGVEPCSLSIWNEATRQAQDQIERPEAYLPVIEGKQSIKTEPKEKL